MRSHVEICGALVWILSNVEDVRYNSEMKVQGDAITEHAFFDPTKNFSFEKYF